MQQIIFKGNKLKILKRFHKGMEAFQIGWPDYSLDFLFQENKNDKIIWKCMTNLSKQDVKEIGSQIVNNSKFNDMVDYTTEGFIVPIEQDNMRGYASVNSVMYREDDGLDVTGNYFVYLLHPVMGSTHFSLEHSGDEDKPWEKTGGAFWLNDEIINLIIEAIETRKIKIDLAVPGITINPQ